MISFGSDNHSGAHPLVIEKLLAENSGHAPSYGTDPTSLRVTENMKKTFGNEAEIFFVFNGTAANVLAISTLVESYHSIICASTSHLQMDECGAPEKAIGCKLVLIESRDGRITPDQIAEKLVRLGDQHASQPKLVSITLPTEYGTCYTLEELRALREFTRAKGLYLHIDGARLVHAANYLKCDLYEITGKLGADAVSFGGTKNGLMFGEAVVVYSQRAKEKLKYLRKQYMQLPSKTRFIAAQFDALLSDDDLWREITSHTHRLALRLRDGLLTIPEVAITQDVQANSVFAKIPKNWVKHLREHYFFYVWDEKTFEVRLMMSFDSTAEHVDDFIKLISELRAPERPI